jgi:DNA-binding transcriptional ArsR family regulator
MDTTKPLPEICLESLSQTLRPDLFKALSDPMRVSIVANLAARGEAATVSDMSQCCGIDFSGVSRHLKLLRDANIVISEKRGREVFYTLNIDNLTGSLRALADALERCRHNSK